MRLFWRKFKKDHKGMTLVELICAVAILGIATTAIGSVLVVGANSYNRGNAEVDLQQESQNTANLISNLVIDANSVEYLFAKDGGWLTAINETDALAQGATNGGDRILKIVRDDAEYQVKYTTVGTEKALVYTQWDAVAQEDGSVVKVQTGDADQLLAEDVSGFAADVSRFASSKNATIELDFMKDNKTCSTTYNITSRNGGNTSSVPSTTKGISISVQQEVVLEPGQSYEFPVTVYAYGAADTGLDFSGLQNKSAGSNSDMTVSGTKATVTVGTLEKSQMLAFTVYTREKQADGVTPMITKTVTIKVRRVNKVSEEAGKGITVNGALSVGTVSKGYADEEYTVTAGLDVYNGERRFEAYDVSPYPYVNPYQVEWSITVDGANALVDNGSGAYVELKESKDGIEVPYIRFKLLQSVEGKELLVTCTAKHPDGTNKMNVDYDDVYGTWKLSPGLKVTVGSDWLRGGETNLLIDESTADPANYSTGVDYAGVPYTLGSIELNWYLINYTGKTYWALQGNEGGWSWGQNTNAGFSVTQTPYDMFTIQEHLDTDRFSYSSPYKVSGFDHSVDKFELVLTLGGGATAQSATVLLDVADVMIQYRNALPTDAEGVWSDASGSHIVYITPDDNVTDYTTYFNFSDGWALDNDDYVLYDRFVGVIRDEAGYASDERYDLTFVDAGGLEYKKVLDNNADISWRYVDSYAGVADIDAAIEHGGYISRSVYYSTNKISSGSDGVCSLTVRVSDEEKAALCTASGTVIKEIYEYNPSFNSTDYYWASDADKAHYDATDGCDGYLEYHFVQSNLQLDSVTDDSLKPSVMYCPRYNELSGTNKYYINTTERFEVGVSQANYQRYDSTTNTWTTLYTMTDDGTKWVY